MPLARRFSRAGAKNSASHLRARSKKDDRAAPGLSSVPSEEVALVPSGLVGGDCATAKLPLHAALQPSHVAPTFLGLQELRDVTQQITPRGRTKTLLQRLLVQLEIAPRA